MFIPNSLSIPETRHGALEIKSRLKKYTIAVFVIFHQYWVWSFDIGIFWNPPTASFPVTSRGHVTWHHSGRKNFFSPNMVRLYTVRKLVLCWFRITQEPWSENEVLERYVDFKLVTWRHHAQIQIKISLEDLIFRPWFLDDSESA